MFLCDLANFSLKDRYNAYVEKQLQKDIKNAEEERRNPGRTLRKNAIQSAGLGVVAPLASAITYAGLTGKIPKNTGKHLLGRSLAAGVIGAGAGMLLRSPRDLKGEGARNKKEKRLLKNVGRGALTGAGLASLTALNLRGKGYGKRDFLGKTLNRIGAGAALGSTGAYLGTKTYNKLKKDEKD
jgi:hypothetical protein